MPRPVEHRRGTLFFKVMFFVLPLWLSYCCILCSSYWWFLSSLFLCKRAHLFKFSLHKCQVEFDIDLKISNPSMCQMIRISFDKACPRHLNGTAVLTALPNCSCSLPIHRPLSLPLHSPCPAYSLFVVRKTRFPLILSGEWTFLRVNSLYIRLVALSDTDVGSAELAPCGLLFLGFIWDCTSP